MLSELIAATMLSELIAAAAATAAPSTEPRRSVDRWSLDGFF
jgi:hypothetical protein